MKKELIICIIIFFLIIIGNVITQNYTKECVYEINKELEILKDECLMKDIKKEKIENKIEDIKNGWNTKKEKLSYYIEHDELEKVETQIYNIKGFCEINKYSEIVPELDKCLFILKHIEEKTALNIKNIF